ncbi:MAG: MBOAT family protein [Leptospiraceae bacterium]|nr:MBOAT family protein [Leptospiraceae bacterium]
MQFNSVHFLFFFFISIILGNILKNTWQRVFLLLASVYFYTYTNTYFIALLVLSTLIDYFAALAIDNENRTNLQKKIYLSISVVFNLLILGYFKYAYLTTDIINTIFGSNLRTFNVVTYYLNILHLYPTPQDPFLSRIVLPVGISFYTFQSMSYTIDVYRKTISARKSFIDFSLYVAFFPQLVAGPIVRATTFFRDLDFRLSVTNEDIQIAITRILIGFMRKLVFADNLGKVVNYTFANYQSMNALEIWTGAIAFGWQIYFDFAGYTDIAIGIARLFGFKFDPNFNFPMTITNITDHWSKWHISFSTWIRDYIYIPLGGSRGGNFITYRNIFITWLFGGVWHGADYHYIAWGLWQAVMLSIHRIYTQTNTRKLLNEKGGILYKSFSAIFTIFCLAFGFVMFRAQGNPAGTAMYHIWEMIKSMLLITENSRILDSYSNYDYGILLIICFWASSKFSKQNIEYMSTSGNKLMYANIAAAFLILIFGSSDTQTFMYFVF